MEINKDGLPYKIGHVLGSITGLAIIIVIMIAIFKLGVWVLAL